eukprot:Hpha_TRINITY_DN9935_c0_g1::TRINITY_DN9935_c0_g1_i1::g.140520::m.140520
MDLCVCAITYASKPSHILREDEAERKRHAAAASIGISPGFPLPPSVAAALVEGGDYNAAFEAGGIPPDSTGEGVLGKLTAGAMGRPSQMEQSVTMALVPLANEKLYSREQCNK